MKNKPPSLEEVRKYCEIPDKIRIEPSMILENAERIHDFICEIGGKNSLESRVLLFAWASHELEMDIEEFNLKFKSGMKESVSYYEKERKNTISLTISLAILVLVIAFLYFN